MIATNDQDSRDSSNKASNTSTKTFQDLQNNISKHFQIELNSFQHLRLTSNFCCIEKIPSQPKKRRGNPCFGGREGAPAPSKPTPR